MMRSTLRISSLAGLLLVAILTMPMSGQAQRKLNVDWFPKFSKRSPNNWKAARVELFLAGGASNYLGELGGRDTKGTDFLFDLEPSQTSQAFGIGLRYFFHYDHSIRTNFYYARVKGDDKTTNQPNRRGRNLHFRSVIYEASAMYEFHIFRPDLRHVMNITNTIDRFGRKFGLYTFFGVGGFYYNPQANYQGAWVPLQPLGTEGQGLPGGPAPYSRIAFAMPIGVGLTYQLKSFNFGLEYGIRFTSTDYLDDASTKYYDNNVIREQKGDVAAFLANPTDNPESGWYETGSIRGDPTRRDTYMFLQLTISRSFAGYLKFENPKGARKIKMGQPRGQRVKKHKPMSEAKRRRKSAFK